MLAEGDSSYLPEIRFRCRLSLAYVSYDGKNCEGRPSGFWARQYSKTKCSNVSGEYDSDVFYQQPR